MSLAWQNRRLQWLYLRRRSGCGSNWAHGEYRYEVDNDDDDDDEASVDRGRSVVINAAIAACNVLQDNCNESLPSRRELMDYVQWLLAAVYARGGN